MDKNFISIEMMKFYRRKMNKDFSLLAIDQYSERYNSKQSKTSKE